MFEDAIQNFGLAPPAGQAHFVTHVRRGNNTGPDFLANWTLASGQDLTQWFSAGLARLAQWMPILAVCAGSTAPVTLDDGVVVDRNLLRAWPIIIARTDGAFRGASQAASMGIIIELAEPHPARKSMERWTLAYIAARTSAPDSFRWEAVGLATALETVRLLLLQFAVETANKVHSPS